MAFESMGNYLFGWIFGTSTLLWPINSHSLLAHIKMQSAFVRYNSHSIVLESKAKKKLLASLEKNWQPFYKYPFIPLLVTGKVPFRTIGKVQFTCWEGKWERWVHLIWKVLRAESVYVMKHWKTVSSMHVNIYSQNVRQKRHYLLQFLVCTWR